ncbi:MAG: AMP-binding protein, partial [Thermoleophilaceae bacterium]|nr:AMP-binding protein [Thermoleophilaceae bacterium]
MSPYSPPPGCQSAADWISRWAAISPPRVLGLDLWLTSAAEARPEATALVADGRSLSYSELERGAESAARRLAALGVGEGDRVAVTLPAGIEFGELLHATGKLGAVFVPLDPRAPDAELRWQLEDCAARVLVDEPLSGDEEGAELRSRTDRDATHSIIYTSGTTGQARGIALSHANHDASARGSAHNLGIDPDDRWLCPLPLFHVGGLAVLLRSAVNRTTAVLHPAFDADAVAAALAAGEATLTSLVPTMLSRLRDAGLESAPGLRAILLGGGPATRELLEWAAEHELPAVLSYGMTETASQVVSCPPDQALERLGQGRPFPGVDLEIGDHDEILVRGPMVAVEALDEDGWLHTGDRGSLDPDGWLTVEGRLKDLIVTGGENVAPLEVESALLEHADVVDAAVASMPDPDWGEAVVAFVVLAESVPAAALRAHCRERLAPYKVPKVIEQVAGIPRNAGGKVLRGELLPG